MKMFLKSMLALMVLVLMMGSVDAKAQCPSGYTSQVVTKSIEVAPGIFCDVELTLCVNIITSGGYTTATAIIQSFKFLDLTCIQGVDLSGGFFQDNLDKAVSESGVVGTIPPCGPPPNISTYQLVVKRAQCYEMIVQQNGTGGTKQLLILACFDATYNCVSTYFVCMDYSYNPPQYVRGLLYRDSGNNVSCYIYAGWVVPGGFLPISRIRSCQPLCPEE